MTDDFGLEEALNNFKETEIVDKEFDRLNNQIANITNNNAALVFEYLPELEAKCTFDHKDIYDENYTVKIEYHIGDHEYTNKVAAISYSEHYPILIVGTRLENYEIKLCNTKEELHEYLKTIAHEQSFINSIRRAKEQIDKIEKFK